MAEAATLTALDDSKPASQSGKPVRARVDGKIYRFPPGTSKDEITKALQQHIGTSVSAKPPLFSRKGLQSLGYTAADKALSEVPVAGSVVGGIVGGGSGSAPGAILGAGVGAGVGNIVANAGRKLLGFETPKTLSEEMGEAGNQAVIGAATEGVGQLGRLAFKPTSEFFARTGVRGSRVPLLPSEAGQGGALEKTMEGFLSHSIPSRGVMEAFRDRQLTQALKVADEEIARISRFRGTPEEMGKYTVNALENSRAALKQDIGAAYKAIDDLTESQIRRVPVSKEAPSSLVDEFGKSMTFNKTTLHKEAVGGVQPETRSLKKAAIALLRRLREQEKLMDPKMLADTRSILEGVVNAPNRVPYRVMADTRSDLLAISRKFDDVLPGKRAGIAKLLTKETDAAMIRAAEDSGISDLPGQIRIANSLTKEMHRKFDQELIKKIMDANHPEMISGFFRKAGMQELRDFNALATNPQRRMVQSQVLKDILGESAEKSASPTGARPTGKFVPEKFAQGFYELGEERGHELFGGSYDSIRNIADLFNRIRPTSASAGAGASLHNYAYIAAIPSTVAAHNGWAGVAGVAADTIFFRTLATAITNPAKAARVFHYLSLASQGAPYAVYGLAQMLKKENSSTQSKSLPSL